ncbi:hypothetical protein KUTeg_016292 [Tegillarca granosa]|uniref:TBC1 domain family member 2B n=1 Tax=Tegillarca granosa TaxID=220873 RepID=A0ABQ9EP84_TEGGR|nr:hypothetical protein KUTeg_016292 [Tegillarca granosa]
MEGGGPGTADSSNLESNSAKSDDQEDENQNEEAEIINENDKKDENTEKDDNTDSAIDRDGKTKVANPEVKLCGWLLIFSRGIINTNRSRWFVFGDNTCKLYYYRNPHDLIPLGEIDIAHASFYFDASNTEKPGSFEIRCFGKEYLLDAHDRHTMMYWLQELQKRRKIYNIKKSSLSKERLGQWSVKAVDYNISRSAGAGDSTSQQNNKGKIVSAFKNLKSKKLLQRSSAIESTGNSTGAHPCVKCKQLQSELSGLTEEHQATEDELQAHREIVRLLQKEMDTIRKEMHTNSKDGECKNSLDQMVMFKDMLKAKDEIIVKLTDQVFELETALNQYKQTNGQVTTPLSDTQESLSDRSSSASNEPVQTVIHTQSPKEVEKLKDMCTAYELQNHKYTKLEANYYQTQSKYLFLLKELKSPVRGGEDRNSQEAINQLLEDALETDAERTKDFVSSLGQEYDKYGFLKKPDIEDEEEADPLVAKATQLERQSAELSAKIKIELDLPRTLPNNKHYECMESDGITKLRNVLLAFSWHNPVIGYCQGLNRLAAIALLFLSEEEAFWCLVAITDHLMPREYYSQTLAGAQTDQRVLKDLLQDKIPKLHYHFEQHSVDISLFTFNWFLTIFVDNNIPPDTFLRVWDTFLYEGSKVLFRFAVAFFKNVEDDMVKQNSALKLNHFFRTMGEKMSNVRRITQLAFHWINPFPMRGISTKRQFYMQQVKGELAELDRFRKDMQTKQQETDMKEYYSDDDL